ncbi:MAG: hypothetical protein EPN31_14755 [Castellaniella sp.]|nr:MAG: hypothetical protein EPN31_14755 [Castellaniella sp.]
MRGGCWRSWELDRLSGCRGAQPQQTDGLMHHGDRGSQYVSIRYTERLAARVRQLKFQPVDSTQNFLQTLHYGLT